MLAEELREGECVPSTDIEIFNSPILLQEMELLFSSLPSFLVAGLAPAFFTADMNYISSVALRNLVTSPSAPPVELEKRFFKPHIEELKKKFENVKTLGLAAAEEWVKGLEANAKEKSADAARWETWEATGGLTKLLKWTSLIDAPQRTPSPSSVFDSSSASTRPTTSGKHVNAFTLYHCFYHFCYRKAGDCFLLFLFSTCLLF